MSLNLMSDYRTLTGFTLDEAVRKLAELLPPNAYKSVPGGANFTDIGPEYLTEKATQVFGLCGIGWYYEYDDDAVSIAMEMRTANSGKERTVYVAAIKKFKLIYSFVNETGKTILSMPIYSNGGSENDNPGFALRGALTNAIGAAFAKLLWQLPVYKGEVTHENAAKLWSDKQKRLDKQREMAAGGGMPAANAKTEVDTPAPKPATVTIPALAPAEQPAEVKEPAPAPVSVPALSDPSHNLEWAKMQKVPEGVGVYTGKPLGEILDQEVGKATVRFLTGTYAKQSGGFFEAKNDALKLVMEAANIIASQVPGIAREKSKKTPK